MQDLVLRGQLLYDMFAGPTFCRFLPLRGAAQWGRLSDTRFEVRLYTDPSQHRGWVTDIDLDQIDRHMNPSTRGIFIELRTAIDDDIATALAGDQKAGEAAHDFAAEVLSALRVVHGVFVAFVRHEYMQHWLAYARKGELDDVLRAHLEQQEKLELAGVRYQQLAAARRASGITIEQLAERLDTAVQNVHRIEKGQNVTLQTLERVARALGLKVQVRLSPDPRGPRTPPPGRRRRAT